MDEVAPARTADELAHYHYLNHLLACGSCYAPTKRHCGVGQALRTEYDAQFVMAIPDPYRRKAIMRQAFAQDPKLGELLKTRVIDLWNEANQEA